MIIPLLLAVAAGSETPPSDVEFVTLDRDVVVKMDLLIGDQGHVKTCSVEETDAPVPFQQAACRALLERARFSDDKAGTFTMVGTHVHKTMRFTAGRHPLARTNLWDAYILTRTPSGG